MAGNGSFLRYQLENNEKILVIDDEKSVQESLRLVLSDRYRVVVASSGKEGLEFLSNDDINMVFLDIIHAR